MELAVYWTQFAEDKLDDIYYYYESTAGTQIARKLISDIIDKTIGLDKNPHIGQKEEFLAYRPQNFRYLD